MSNENDTSTTRFELEQQRLLKLAEAFGGIEVDCIGTAHRDFKIKLNVRSIADVDSNGAKVQYCDEHQVEVNLPLSYPDSPPQIRWMTPIFHPNVSLSGYLDANDMGIDWSNDMDMIIVCERIWDIARFNWVDLETANNYGAARWWRENKSPGPTDSTAFSVVEPQSLENVISYHEIESNLNSSPANTSRVSATPNNQTLRPAPEHLGTIEIVDDPTISVEPIRANELRESSGKKTVVAKDVLEILDSQIAETRDSDDTDSEKALKEISTAEPTGGDSAGPAKSTSTAEASTSNSNVDRGNDVVEAEIIVIDDEPKSNAAGKKGDSIFIIE